MGNDPQPSARLKVKVVPGSSRDQIAGWLGDALKIKVTAPPERGKANEAVIEILADRPARNSAGWFLGPLVDDGRKSANDWPLQIASRSTSTNAWRVMLTLSRASRIWRPSETIPPREPSLRLRHSCASEWGAERLGPVTTAVRRWTWPQNTPS